MPWPSVKGSLGLDSMHVQDLFLLHDPTGTSGERLNGWKALLRVQSEGKVRAVGVSNFVSLLAPAGSLQGVSGARPGQGLTEALPRLFGLPATDRGPFGADQACGLATAGCEPGKQLMDRLIRQGDKRQVS